MDDFAVSIDLGGTILDRIDAPADIACWSGQIPSPDGGDPVGVSIVMQPPADVSGAALAAAQDVARRFAEFEATAVAYLRGHLPEPAYALSADELADLHSDPPPLDQPDVAVWGDGSWMLRFATGRLRLIGENGLGVMFEGELPTEILILDDEDEL